MKYISPAFTLGLLLMIQSADHCAAQDSTSRPVVIAHRGASGYLPEHTAIAKVLAHSQGADYIEQDVVLSKDGVPVVCHDVTLESISDVAKVFPGRAREDGRFYAIDFELAELKRLSLTERMNPKTGKPVFSTRFATDFGSPILTLAEELSLIRGMNQTSGREAGIYPEIKRGGWHNEQTETPLWKIVWETCRQAGYETKDDACFIQSFEPDDLKALKQAGCQLRLVQLLGSAPVKATEAEKLEWAKEIAAYADGIGPAIQLIVDAEGNSTGIVEAAHQAGLVVHPYTVRDDALPNWASDVEGVYKTLVGKLGVDGFFTDFPDTGVRFSR
jgi:glycerophosphoryl diester phosphodiesterase